MFFIVYIHQVYSDGNSELDIASINLCDKVKERDLNLLRISKHGRIFTLGTDGFHVADRHC